MLKYEGHRCYPAGYEDDSDASVDGMEILPPPSLRITVVPNITKGAGLNWEDFDATLTEEMETWFVSFEKMWNIYKRTPSMIQNLKVVYLNDENPLLLALKFFSRCPGCNNLKNKNLALFVLDTVCNLYKTNPEIAEMCTDNMRMVAFNFIKTCGVLPLYKSITETFELTKIKDLLMGKIQELIDDKRYKDAAYWAINLRVTQCFDIYQIVLPLILQSKSSLAVECLDLAKDQQEETVRFLDSLLDKQKTVLDHCYQIIEKHGYIDLNHSVISFRPMSKLVARLAKMYDIGAHCTPNLSYTKSWSYMYYLYKRFKDGEMSRDSFRELVKDAATTTALRYGLVSNIASHGDREEALYWVRLYQIPTDQWPSSLQADIPADVDQTNDTVDGWESDQSPLSQSNSSLASSGKPHGKGEYLQLELRDESVILVDRRSAFMSMIRTLETQSLIGFDSEWKPSACQVESVSLLQLATYDKVFLIDVTSDEITDDLWKVLGRNIFNNLEILKIGFALQQDLNMLQKSLPQMNLCLASASCYLDLKDLWKRLMYLQCFAFPYKGASRVGTSLSALTEICLGKKLDKSNQLSNWAKRPLRRDQIIYAAVDVFCLIQIYKVIADSLNRLGYDIDQMVDQITSSHSTKPDRMANKSLDSTASSRLPRKTSRNAAAESISSTDIRFFCDGMLGGLLHNLRRLGIDCLEINGRANVEQIIRRAQQENRYILARDSRFTQNAKSQTKSFCIEIPEDAADVQVVNVIQYFNIAINKKKVNPRCPTCNGLEFISATRHQMQILKFGVSPQSVAFSSASNSASYWHKSVKFIFHSKPITEEVLSTGKTFSLAVIKVGKLSTNNVFAHNVFFICDKCGRITWPSDYRLSSKIEQQIVAED